MNLGKIALNVKKTQLKGLFFVVDKAPSFEAREAHKYLNNRLGIFRARAGGLLDHQ